MDTYEFIKKVNEVQIMGVTPEEAQLQEDCKVLIELAHNPPSTDPRTSKWYPYYYTPDSESNDIYRTITLIKPKTKIYAYNSFELEILRILSMYAPNNDKVKIMLINTKNRLDKTCFGHFCPKGECFDTSIVVLRFLNQAFPQETNWISKIFEGIKEYITYHKCSARTLIYYLLVLTELNMPLKEYELENCRVWMKDITNKIRMRNKEEENYVRSLSDNILCKCNLSV